MFLKASEAREIYKLIETACYDLAATKLQAQNQAQSPETHFLNGLLSMKLNRNQKAYTEFNLAIKQSNDTELKLYTHIQLGYASYGLAQKQSSELGKIAARKAWQHALECLCELMKDQSVGHGTEELRRYCDDTDYVWIDLLRLYNQQGFLREASVRAGQLSEFYNYPSDSAYTLTLQAELKLTKVLYIWSQFKTAQDSLNALHFEAITGFEKVLELSPGMIATETILDEYNKLLSRSKDLDAVAYDRYCQAAIQFSDRYKLKLNLEHQPISLSDFVQAPNSKI